MICKSCRQQIEDNALFCKHCGYKPFIEAQKERVDKAKLKVGDTVVTSAKSPLMVVSAIIYSVMLLGYVISAASGGITGILGAALSVAFMIVSLVGLWKCVGAKDRYSAANAFRRLSCYDNFNVVMATIAFVFSIIIGAIIVLAVTITTFKAGSYGYSDIGVGAWFLVMGAVAVVIAYFAVVRSLYKNRREYFLSLKYYAESGNYLVSKAPVADSIVIGAFTLTSAIGSVLVSSMLTTILYEGFAILGDLGIGMSELSDIFDSVEGVVVGAAVISVISGLSQLLLGVYYILSGVWIAKAHSVARQVNDEFNQEMTKLNALEKKTNAAISTYNAEVARALDLEKENKRRAEEAAVKARLEAERLAEEESKKAKEAMQEQQMLMMQMMMQKMMSGNNNEATQPTPVVVPVVTAPANDANILELQREKEAAEAKAKAAEEQQKMMMQMMQKMMENMNNSSKSD